MPDRVGARRPKRRRVHGRGTGPGKGSLSEKTEPQQQPWTSAGISRSRLTRLGLGGFPPMNGSTDASCQTGMACAGGASTRGRNCWRPSTATRKPTRGRAALSSPERAGGASVAARQRRNARRVAGARRAQCKLQVFQLTRSAHRSISRAWAIYICTTDTGSGQWCAVLTISHAGATENPMAAPAQSQSC